MLNGRRQVTMAALLAVSCALCASCASGGGEADPGPQVKPVAASAAPAAPETQPVDPFAWPRQFQQGGVAFAIHQPQLRKWDGNRIEAQSAVAVTPPGK